MKKTINPLAIFAMAGSLLLSLSGTLHAQKIRPNIDDLKDDQIKTLQAAMKAIKALPHSSTMSYYYLRELHNQLDGCEHGNESFLPWHRALLLSFEKALQQSGVPGAEDIMLPYWDWSKQPSGKRFPKIAEDKTSEFWADRRNLDDPYRPYANLETAMKETDWVKFAGRAENLGGGYGSLENPTHNMMHAAYIGGAMRSNTTAARDPLFWPFHAGIDYFWWKWQREPAHANVKAVEPDYKLRLFDNKTVADMMDTGTLGYTYGVTEARPVAVALRGAPVPAPVHAMAMAMRAAPQPVKLQSVDFVVPPPGFSHAQLVISDVRRMGVQSYSVRYYIHPTNVKASAGDEAFDDRYLAGTDAILGEAAPTGTRDHVHMAPKLTVNVDVTEAMTRLAASHAGKTWRISAVFEGAIDPATGKPVPLILGRDVDEGEMRLVLGE